MLDPRPRRQATAAMLKERLLAFAPVESLERLNATTGSQGSWVSLASGPFWGIE